MRTNKKFLSSLLAAAMVSAAMIGNAFADDPDDTVGDLTGDKPLSIRLMQIQNQRALAAAQNRQAFSRQQSNAAYADFPDQTVGDLNGNNPVPVRRQAANNSLARGSDKPLLILQFQGDWNGTAKKGFPHQ